MKSPGCQAASSNCRRRQFNLTLDTPAAIVLNKIKLTSEQGMKLMDYPEPLFMILRIERS
jgi:hypothetical protein